MGEHNQSSNVSQRVCGSYKDIVPSCTWRDYKGRTEASGDNEVVSERAGKDGASQILWELASMMAHSCHRLALTMKVEAVGIECGGRSFDTVRPQRLAARAIACRATEHWASVNSAHFVSSFGIPVDPELQLVIDAWPRLNEQTRGAVVVLLKAASR